MKRLATLVAIILSCLFLCVLALGLFVVLSADVSTSSTSSLKSGRTITATYHGWAGISASDTFDSTTLDMAGHRIVVAPAKLLVDGRTVAKIDVQAMAVNVHGDKREIRVVADGKPVATIAR